MRFELVVTIIFIAVLVLAVLSMSAPPLGWQ